jgi:hypothetical protein
MLSTSLNGKGRRGRSLVLGMTRMYWRHATSSLLFHEPEDFHGEIRATRGNELLGSHCSGN